MKVHHSAVFLGIAIGLILLAGCKSLWTRVVPGAGNTIDATRYLLERADAGNLPGISKGERFQARSWGLAKRYASGTNHILIVTIEITPTHEPDTAFWYWVSRTNAQMWCLARACRVKGEDQPADWLYPTNLSVRPGRVEEQYR